MSTTAVIVLEAIARDEFERDWHGFEEPFSFIDGDLDELPPVETFFTTAADGGLHTLKARDVASLVCGQLAAFREEIDEEEDNRDDPDDGRSWFDIRTDDERDEMARERLWQHWTDQLDGEAEFLKVVGTRTRYVVEGWKAMVADFGMIGDRFPEMRPVLAEKLSETYQALIDMLGDPEEQSEPPAEP